MTDKELAKLIGEQYAAGYSDETMAATITEARAEERALLDACLYFLNMLPNERHPNNRHGIKTSYDLAHKLTVYFNKNGGRP